MKLVRALFILFSFLASASVHALEIRPYTPAALAQAQQSDSAYALHFHADWCPVCRAQSIVLNRLKADPKLNVTVFVVDYDTEKALRRPYGVHTQSTLIAFRGRKETDRLAGVTDPDAIRAVLESAL
jgi:thioredoxin 1